MTVEELKKLIEQGQKVQMLDVREADEYRNADSVPGSVNVPMGKVFVKAAKDELPKDQKIITICKSGTRCEIVARELKQKGYDIEHLEGGIDAWHATS